MEHDLGLEGKGVTPGGVRDLEVGVEGGKVAEVGRGLKGARKIKTGRSLIFPGFIDMHVHLREPGWERKEDFRTGTQAAAHGGVTTVVDMPNNPVPTTTKEALDTKRALAALKGVVDVKFYGGVSRERPADLGGISQGVVGYKLYLSETTGAAPLPAGRLTLVFREVEGTSRPLSIHCEDQGVIERSSRLASGEGRADAYCDMRPPEAETAAVRAVLAELRSFRGLAVNVCHASVGETLDLLKSARGEGLRVWCEGALHHLYFNRSAMLENERLKTNPPLRGEEDRRALVRGLGDGSVSFLVTDHAPHLVEEKTEMGLAGVPGLDDYAHIVSWLIREEGVDPVDVARVSAWNPARHLGLGDRGAIAPGKRADFSVIDLRSPEVVKEGGVRSKCAWSPYEGREFPGRARWTIVGGELLVDDFEFAA